MATESIFHNFTFSKPEEVRRFAKALEHASKKSMPQVTPRSSLITEPSKIKEFFQKSKEN